MREAGQVAMPDAMPTDVPLGGQDGFLPERDRLSIAPQGVVAQWPRAIEERRRACRDVPAGYHVMLVPDRRAVYADKLPAEPGHDAARLPDALRDLVIDPGPGLRARRRISETYLRTGSGWTDYGAYAASRDLIEALRERIEVAPAPEAALQYWEEPALGDLALSAGSGSPADAEPERTLRISHPGEGAWRRAFGASNRSGGSVQIFEHRDRSLPRALAFAARGAAGDSLARMLPFLCGSFSRLVAVSSPDLFLDLMESEQPDAVFKLLAQAELSEPPALMRRDFPAWSGLSLPLSAPPSGIEIGFAADGNAQAFLRQGWSKPEQDHIWSLGEASTLAIEGPLPDCAHDLSIDLSPCVFPPDVPSQRLGVEANGRLVGSFKLTESSRVAVELSAQAIRSAPGLTLRFVHPDFVTPAAIGQNDDDRPLAFCFGRLELRAKARG